METDASLNLVLNRSARPRVMTVGLQVSRVVIIDDLLENAGEVVDYAAQARFSPSPVQYPGMNAPFPRPAVATLLAGLRRILRDGYGVPLEATLGCHAFFGLVAQPESELTFLQTIPHVDDVTRFRLAGVLYLCDEAYGGTGFYRQKSTGLECVPPEHHERYRKAAEAEAARRAGHPAAYFQDSDDDYERIGEVEARFNRLILYPSFLLHSGLVRPERLSSDPRTGRLTANFFIGPGGG